MGQRSGTQTIVGILLAFTRQRTWSQAELAREVGVGVPALRRKLVELQEQGVPLEPDDEPPHVYWSVPKGWFPGGVALSAEEARDIVRRLARMPKSRGRDAIVAKLLATAADLGRRVGARPALVVADQSANEEAYLPLCEDAQAQGSALQMRYLSASRGVVEWRHVSVVRVAPGPPARIVGVCHRSRSLKWFRVDNIVAASIDANVPALERAEEDVDLFVASSVDGFHDGLEPLTVRFFVRAPEERWVKANLPSPMRIEDVPGGIVVEAKTSAPVRIARFVVGLGAAARCETEELRAAVEELARGALGGDGGAEKPAARERAGAKSRVRKAERVFSRTQPVERMERGRGV